MRSFAFLVVAIAAAVLAGEVSDAQVVTYPPQTTNPQIQYGCGAADGSAAYYAAQPTAYPYSYNPYVYSPYTYSYSSPYVTGGYVGYGGGCYGGGCGGSAYFPGSSFFPGFGRHHRR